MTPEQQQAAEKLQAAIRSRFSSISPTIIDSGMGPAVKLGVSPDKLSEIEAAMQDLTMEIMLDTGVLVMLMA